MTKDEIAAALDEIGTLLALQGENDFRTRAYSNGARTLAQLDGDLAELIATKQLGKVRGIGEALEEKITTLFQTGRLPYLDDLKAAVPPGLLTMLRLPGIGPKKVRALNLELGLETIAALKTACEAGQVAALKGFGEKTQTKILEGIAFLDVVGNRVRIDKAIALGEALLEQIRAFPGVIRAELCGSLRRRRETAKDIDIVVSSTDAAPIMAAFVALQQVLKITGQGPTKSSIIAEMNYLREKIVLNADLRVVSEAEFPYAVLHFTGSKDHNVRLRQLANDRGLSLNEYALSWTDAANTTPIPQFKTEQEIYAHLGLDWIAPELREDTGELEAAASHTLPILVESNQIRGVFHNHTLASDGTASLEEMALACKKLGLEYFGVGDHSQSLTVANGLTPDRVRAQWAEIDVLNARLKGIHIFKGTEVDILEDGTLDFEDDLLAGFDYVVASVHSFFNLSEEAQTKRICTALSHPSVTMLGHATGRLLLRREGYKVDLNAVIQTAAKFGKMIEINAQPDRLDLDWTYVKRAKALGVPLVINPDAHHPDDLALYPYGVNVARRGWLTAADVFNTLPLAKVRARLKRQQS